MSFGLQNGVIALTPTGRIDSEFPDGNDGSDVTPSWTSSAPNLSSLQVGTTFSVDLEDAGFFIDPGSPVSELGFNYVSGQPALTAGFSFTGTVLSNNCALATSGAFRLVAVRNGISRLSSVLSFVISAPSGIDNVATTVPTGITVAPGTATGTISLTCDQPSDVAPGSTPASGADHVDILVNGALSAPSPIVTPANALPPPTNVNLGSITSPSVPAFSQSGKLWTASAAGTGIAATTSEQCLFYPFGVYSGAQRFIGKLNPYTSSSSTALSGLMVHETGVAGGKFIAIGLRPSNGTVGLYIISRATSGGTSSQVATQINDINGQPITGPVYVFIQRAADNKTWTISYSLNELGRNQITVQTLTMIAAVNYGGFLTSQSAGNNATATIEEISITSGISLTATINATSPVSIQLRSVDVAGNTSALSTVIQGVPKAAASGAVKFNPSVAYFYIDQNQSRSAQLARMQALKAANPWIRGFQVFWTWADLENPALVGGAAQYDGSWASQTDVNSMKGFKLMDTFVNACAAMGCQFALHIYSYGGASAAGAQSTSFPASFAPAYLAGSPTSPYGPNTASSNGIHGGVWINSYAGNAVGVARYYRYWVPAVMQRITAWSTAYGNKYDSNQNVEVVSFLDETAMSTQTSYSDSGAASTMQGSGGYFQAGNAAWPHTQRRVWANYVGSSVPAMDALLASAYANKWAIGGPDTANESGASFRAITADWRFRGLTSALGNGGVRDPTVPDYRTLGASNMREVEPEDLTANTPPGTRSLGDGIPAHIVAQANLMAATHMFWYDNRFAGPDTNRTDKPSPNLLDFIHSALLGGNVAVNGVTAGISLTNTTLPSSLAQ